ncbi:glycosyltransferase [Rossellomorea vietnamensis]|uniref:glycosyltransferase n=1 Tax=Rossellomorea vietnamensis TaxID=218284 RepID=UPI0009A5F37A|nr:glycosyl transferase [Bacillus sp. DSM 27956]PRX75773.1 glycosyltransferase involved in cell wall biosynthesis [Bacillus sp. V-88]WQI94225.1 glycosyltransferase [Rossellomorea vietnamensis]SLK23422.1 Glycosyltransferase involved in cell wall bisynthesis [Bacillus sp. V-88]
MKKNILFIMPSLSAGGGEKSLVNLLSQIDYTLYNVDLFLFNHEGLFMDFIPKEVNVLPLPKMLNVFSLPLFSSVIKFLIKGKLNLVYNRFMFCLNNRTKKSISIKEQKSWKYLSASIDGIQKKYDTAIGFLEKTSTYFCVEKVNAKNKIGWVHIDYDNLGMNPSIDVKYFESLDNIVTVSEECAAILRNRFPTVKEKISVIYNIVSPNMINKMADQYKDNVYNKKEKEVTILSIGRLHYQKGYELSIRACKKLVEHGHNIKWYVIGEGEERAKLTRLIGKLNLQDHFILMGLKANPYPFIKQADIYVQTSRFEGKSIALDEAKILKKPIVVTNFSTAKDQIKHEVDGIIVEMNPCSVASEIESIIENQPLRELLVNNLSELDLGTEREIQKLYQICN